MTELTNLNERGPALKLTGAPRNLYKSHNICYPQTIRNLEKNIVVLHPMPIWSRSLQCVKCLKSSTSVPVHKFSTR